MAAEWERAAEKFIMSEQGNKLRTNRAGLEKIANSADGQKLRSILEQQNINEAIESGDISALKNTLSSAMNTEAGARLLNEISKMMEK